MGFHFFAAISRMKYIDRWALMRNSRQENLSEHSSEVAMIAHALCTIGNVRYGRNADADLAALMGLYHDASEIITGDMPTPVKYYSRQIRDAYKNVEHVAEEKLLDRLPEDLQPSYRRIFFGPAQDAPEQEREEYSYLKAMVKAADKLSALIKCMEEESAGNTEFADAKKGTLKSLQSYKDQYPEVKDYMEDFLPSYGMTLDQLLK